MDTHFHDEEIELCGDCSGRFLLVTASGAGYLLDCDAGTAQRVSGWAEPVLSRGGEFESAALRRDGEQVALVTLAPVRLGSPATLLLHGASADNDTLTVRMTTPVVLVRRVDGASSPVADPT
ncbi:MAG: hypothetical protein Q4G67_12185 [Actinomycetia bacterium]|nr:hypothetical protein [Actinomycetes bacterium]